MTHRVGTPKEGELPVVIAANNISTRKDLITKRAAKTSDNPPGSIRLAPYAVVVPEVIISTRRRLATDALEWFFS